MICITIILLYSKNYNYLLSQTFLGTTNLQSLTVTRSKSHFVLQKYEIDKVPKCEWSCCITKLLTKSFHSNLCRPSEAFGHYFLSKFYEFWRSHISSVVKDFYPRDPCNSDHEPAILLHQFMRVVCCTL